MPKWLKDAVFYEIYPQSFNDTNGDGIGDLEGIIEKLDYVKSLGCNALWINPCFDSPFKDAGYDVRDYKKVAPRYGTNEDLVRLFDEAHKKGIHVLLDLVPGHTSEEHEWFKMSQKAEKNEYSNRYPWTNFCFQPSIGYPCISGESERNGSYVLNFFKCQPALNYGFLKVDQDWQLPVDHPDCIATREALKDIMRFWMDLGCDGYRVDMASSLVKNDDENKSGTCAIWRNIREMMDKEYPEAALVSEWSNPRQSLKAGFHMDFYLNDPRMGGACSLMRDYSMHADGTDHSYFKKDAGGSILTFLCDYMPQYKATKNDGYFCMITCNHDTIRARYTLDEKELKLAYAFVFTMPGVPYLYYGDEIGMRYLDLPTKEGGYFRTGSRTPMQWDDSKNMGFSDAEADRLYLPQDPAPDAPTVKSEEADPDSLLNTVKAVIALRHQEEDLQADSPFDPIIEDDDKPFVYRRGALLLAVNPGGEKLSCELPKSGEVLYAISDVKLDGCSLSMGPQSFVIIK